MDEQKPGFLVEALDNRWNSYYTKLKTCRQEVTQEAVHDLWVATRRLVSLLRLLRTIIPHGRLEKLYKSYRDQMDCFEELRDVQVMAVEVSEAMETLPEGEPFLSYLEKREKRLLRSSDKLVQSLKIGNLIKRISAIRRSLLKSSGRGDEHNRQVLDALDEIFSLVLHRAELLDPSKPATIHQLWIAFRRFRYLIEISNPILPDFPKKSLATMRDLEDSMGYIQDIETLFDHLTEFVEKEPSFDPTPVRSFFEARYDEAIRTFFQAAPAVRVFWRSSRRAMFPWRRRSRTGKPQPPASRQAGDSKAAQSVSDPSNPG